MKLFVALAFFYFIPSICLNPKRLPNGKMYTYKANKLSPASDLKVISSGQASLITKNWLQNIVSDIFHRENKKLQEKQFSQNNIFDYDDLHIVTNINKLESYIQESYQDTKGKKTHFLSWMPEGVHVRTEVLFIIVAFILV